MSNLSNDGGYTKGFLLGAIVGGAVGAITALLLAPKSGKELRGDIASKSTELYDKANDYFQNLESNVGSVVTNTVNEGKERAQNIIHSAKKQAEVLLQNAEKIMQDARLKATTTKENVQSKIGNLKDAAKASADAFRDEMHSETEL